MCIQAYKYTFLKHKMLLTVCSSTFRVAHLCLFSKPLCLYMANLVAMFSWCVPTRRHLSSLFRFPAVARSPLSVFFSDSLYIYYVYTIACCMARCGIRYIYIRPQHIIHINMYIYTFIFYRFSHRIYNRRRIVPLLLLFSIHLDLTPPCAYIYITFQLSS